MAKFQFKNFGKGWYFRKPQLIGLDGFSDVNNFVMYKDSIEKVKGWKALILVPSSAPIDSFTQGVIDDYQQIIDTVT